MPDYLLDCNHLGTALRKVSPVRERIHQARKAGHRFISYCPVLSELGVGIQGRVLSQVDMMLAALARQHRLTLLTTDRDFEVLTDLRLENRIV
jgi:predicted nucleic acid-binding protein